MHLYQMNNVDQNEQLTKLRSAVALRVSPIRATAIASPVPSSTQAVALYARRSTSLPLCQALAESPLGGNGFVRAGAARCHRAVVEGELWPGSSVTADVGIPGKQAQPAERRGIDNSRRLEYDRGVNAKS
jgi:hypothetical protein